MVAGSIVGGCVLCLLWGIAATLLKEISEEGEGGEAPAVEGEEGGADVQTI